jgi:hypothetical protein
MSLRALSFRVLPETEWTSYFDQASKRLDGERAMLEIKDLPIGDRRQARCLPLYGFAYDAKGKTLEIAMDGLDHLIEAPRQIAVSEGPDGLESIEVIDAHKQTQIVTIVKPLRTTRRHQAS